MAWCFLKKLKTEPPFSLAIHISSNIYPEEGKARTQRDVCILRFTAALITSQKGEAIQVPVDRRMGKQKQHIHKTRALFSLRNE